MRTCRNLTALQMVRKLKNNGYNVKWVINALRRYLKNTDTQCGFMSQGVLIKHNKYTNTYDVI